MKITKIISLLLALLMLTGALMSCKKTEEQPDAADSGSGVVSTDNGRVLEYDENGYQLDFLPDDINYGGKQVTILGWTNRFNEFTPREDAIDDVSYKLFVRNTKVKERFGVDFNWVTIKGDYEAQGEYVNYVTNNALAGDSEFDILASYSMITMTLAMQGYLMNLRDCNYIDFENPWWPDTLVTQASVGDALYGASGDIALSYYEMLTFLVMNKSIFENYHVKGSPVDDYKNGTWTLEKMLQYASQVSDDRGEEGKDSVNDTFGLTVKSVVHFDYFIAGWDFNFITCDSNGTFKIGKDVENANKGQDLFELLTDALFGSEYGYYGINDSEGVDSIFVEGRTLFYPASVNSLGKALSNGLDYDYYILPFPKYNEDQTNYSTNLGFEYSMFMIPNNGRDTDMPALIMEALASEGHRTTTPAMYDTKVKYRYSGSEAVNAEVFDVLRNTTYFDASRFLYDVLSSNSMNPVYTLRYCISDDSATWTSKISAMRVKMGKYLDETLTATFKKVNY